MIVGTLAAQGQGIRCDPLPAPESGRPAYQARGNRCEGFYLEGYGAQSIELISFTLGPIVYPLQSGVTLNVSAPSGSSPVHVRAVPKPPRMAYRMDAVLDPGGVLAWPVNDVLLPENISAGRIGIFGWKEGGQTRTYVPLRVSQTKPGALVSGTPALLTIRLSFDAELVKWRSAPLMRDACAAFSDWKDATTHAIDAGQPVDVSLVRLEGSNCLELAAKSGSANRWITEPIRVDLPSR